MKCHTNARDLPAVPSNRGTTQSKHRSRLFKYEAQSLSAEVVYKSVGPKNETNKFEDIHLWRSYCYFPLGLPFMLQAPGYKTAVCPALKKKWISRCTFPEDLQCFRLWSWRKLLEGSSKRGHSPLQIALVSDTTLSVLCPAGAKCLESAPILQLKLLLNCTHIYHHSVGTNWLISFHHSTLMTWV